MEKNQKTLIADIIAKAKAKQDHIDSIRGLTSKEIEPTLKKIDGERVADNKKRNADLAKAATAKAKVHIDAAKDLDKATADAVKKQTADLAKSPSNPKGGRTDAALAQKDTLPKATAKIQESEENMDQDSFGQLEEFKQNDKYSEKSSHIDL